MELGRDPEFDRQLCAVIPEFRRKARIICSDPDLYEDLVQQTIFRALRAHQQYSQGTNDDMLAWLYVIARNVFRTSRTRAAREVQDDGRYAGSLVAPAGQDDAIQLIETAQAISRLSKVHQQVIGLIGVLGLSYEEMAERAGVNVGTVKSRMSRARQILATELSIQE
jgi:RNA polymerase sigma-70 factor (ECF subfamily)